MKDSLHFLIFHGTMGNAQGNWFPWLKASLESESYTVDVPQMPTPEGQSYANWRKTILPFLSSHPPEHTVLIGHSCGATFALRLLEEAAKQYHSAFLVCPLTRKLGLHDFDVLNETFVDHPFDWGRISAGAKSIKCYAGDNDPYIPLTHVQEIAANAKASLKIIENGGHLNADTAGYTTFPQLLDEIKNVIKGA